MIAVVMYDDEYPVIGWNYWTAPDTAVDEIINSDDIHQYMFNKSPTWENTRVETHGQEAWDEQWKELKNYFDYVFVLPVTEEWEDTGEYPMFRDIFYWHDGKRHVA